MKVLFFNQHKPSDVDKDLVAPVLLVLGCGGTKLFFSFTEERPSTTKRTTLLLLFFELIQIMLEVWLMCKTHRKYAVRRAWRHEICVASLERSIDWRNVAWFRSDEALRHRYRKKTSRHRRNWTLCLQNVTTSLILERIIAKHTPIKPSR